MNNLVNTTETPYMLASEHVDKILPSAVDSLVDYIQRYRSEDFDAEANGMTRMSARAVADFVIRTKLMPSLNGAELSKAFESVMRIPEIPLDTVNGV